MQNEKKILIVSHAMEIGGAERALIGLLNSLDTDKYDVDLFLYRHEGELMKFIPEKINLLKSNKSYAQMAVPIMSAVKSGKLGVAYGRYIAKRKAARYVSDHFPNTDNQVELTYSHKYTVKYMPMISYKEYDLAISFLTPHYYAAEKVRAKKKIAWIHTDYSFINIDIYTELEMWSRYEYIASISENVTEAFLKKFPSLEDRIIQIENIISPKLVRAQAEEFSAEKEMPNSDFTRLLSIGRFANAKNFDNIPDICRRLIDKGIKIKWYIIGYGGDENKIRDKIAEYHMEDNVIILGKKENPYPYIKECDIYVQPSRYEGKAVTVREAQILCKPVIITNFPTAKSQVEDGFDGVIVPLDNENCASGIAKIIKDTGLLNKLVENCKNTDYGNEGEAEKLYRLMEE